MNRWKRLLREIRADVKAARERDPAAQNVSTFEILSSWAGVQALLAHRAVADDDEPLGQAAHRLDRYVDVLVGQQAGDDE